MLPATRRALLLLAKGKHGATLEQVVSKRRSYLSGNPRREGLEDVPRDVARQVRDALESIIKPFATLRYTQMGQCPRKGLAFMFSG
jgi:hypothetical protein